MDKLQEILKISDSEMAKLSAKASIPLERVRSLADGAEPTMGELRRLAETLRLSVADFAPPGPTERDVDLLFRRAPVAGGSVPGAAVLGLSRKVAYSFDLLGGDRDIASWWVSQFQRSDNTLESADRNAATFRTLFCNDDQLSPLLSLPRIATERMKLMLFVVRNPSLDGASAFFDGIPFVFVSARFPARMLFTLAHEIGHLIAHHEPSLSFAFIDESTGAEEAIQKRPVDERYADAFASALLMPSASVGLTLKKIRELAKSSSEEIGDIEINYLARIFGVSFWAAARRCEDLKLLPVGGAASLNTEVAKRYGSAEKRADQVGLPPRPKIEFPPVPRPLLESAVNKIRAGEISVGRAATILGLSISDLVAANAPTAH